MEKKIISEKPVFFRAKNATVSTLRSGTDYCWLYCDFNSIRKLIKNANNNCLNKLNELKFCEVSLYSISNRCWKFQLAILKNKKVLFLKKYFLSCTAKIDPKDGVSRLNLQRRFWFKYATFVWTHQLPFFLLSIYLISIQLAKSNTYDRQVEVSISVPILTSSILND